MSEQDQSPKAETDTGSNTSRNRCLKRAIKYFVIGLATSGYIAMVAYMLTRHSDEPRPITRETKIFIPQYADIDRTIQPNTYYSTLIYAGPKDGQPLKDDLVGTICTLRVPTTLTHDVEVDVLGHVDTPPFDLLVTVTEAANFLTTCTPNSKYLMPAADFAMLRKMAETALTREEVTARAEAKIRRERSELAAKVDEELHHLVLLPYNGPGLPTN